MHMSRPHTVLLMAAVALVTHGCAVTPVSSKAQGIRVISEAQSKSCKFINSISTNNGNTLSKNPEEEARNRAMNRVAELGGNALRIVTTNQQVAPSGVGSIFALTGEAYSCR